MGSSLVDRAKEMKDGAMIHGDTVLSMRNEINRAQWTTKDLETRVVELEADKVHSDAALTFLEKEVAG